MTDETSTGDAPASPPLALPSPGVNTADLGTVLTLREIATRLGKSPKTVRRMVTGGVFADAHQAPIPNGGGQTQWVVPYSSLLAWERDQADKAARVPPAARPQADERDQQLAELRTQVEHLRRDLAETQARADERERVNEQLSKALEAMSRALPAAQETAQTVAAEIAAQVAAQVAAQTRRRRWRRKHSDAPNE